jgi:peptidoglycan/LPS O-acetylase OafA/YrhL
MAVKQTLQAIVFAWMVMRAATGFGGAVGRFLSAGPTVYLGKISYGVYLAHGFAGDILGTFGVSSASLPEPLRFLVLAGMTVGVAALSWHLVEGPINALKARVPYAALTRAAAPA